MKRGLKRLQFAALAPLPTAVEESAPMKRGLKLDMESIRVVGPVMLKRVPR